METLGICLGASTLGMVRLKRDGETIHVLAADTITHEGNPRQALLKALEQVPGVYEIPIAVTGRKFIGFVNLSSISEPEAVERAVAHTRPPNDPHPNAGRSPTPGSACRRPRAQPLPSDRGRPTRGSFLPVIQLLKRTFPTLEG